MGCCILTLYSSLQVALCARHVLVSSFLLLSALQRAKHASPIAADCVACILCAQQLHHKVALRPTAPICTPHLTVCRWS